MAYNQHKLYKTLDYWSLEILNFHFLEKGLGIAFPQYFGHEFSRKMFLVLYSINWPFFITWLPLLLEILGNMCNAIVFWIGCDVIHFEINVIFLNTLFRSYNLMMNKITRGLMSIVKSRCKCSLENEKEILKAHPQVWDDLIESPLKMMKNAFYFASEASVVLKIFTFLSWIFGLVAKRLEGKVNFEFYDVTGWLTDNCNTHIVQYLEK